MINIKKYAPIIHEGIPDINPESVSYREFWDEQIERCKNGYKPKGLDAISGKHYYYLNFYKILGNSGEKGGRKTLIAPWYRDMDKEYFDLFETCKEEEKGMIVIKARDKGFSYMNSGMLAQEFTFYSFNEVGIAAGLQVTADSFFEKVKKGVYNQHDIFRHSILKDTDTLLRSGYKKKNKDGKWEVGGFQSNVHCRTMSNPEVFKGERLSVMVFEEAGEFKELLNAYMSSKACFMDGNIQFGVPIIGGTGGDIETSSKDFMDMYYNADAFNLIPMFIPATRCYHGFFDLKTGVSDIKGAEEKLFAERKQLKQSNNQKGFNLHVQNYPLTVEEAFLQTKSSKFNIAKINDQRSTILSSSEVENQIQSGRLEWDENGMNVIWHPDDKGPYKILSHPEIEYKGLDIGGIDSYDQDIAEASKSLGSAIIYRRFYSVDKPSNYVVAEYTERPKTAEEFWDGCLKLAVYYNSQMLIEFTKIGIIDYFRRMGGIKYLKERPKTAHSPRTVNRNRYGIQMNKHTKAVMEQYLNKYVEENCEDIWFITLLDELANYGIRNTDRVIAFGLCLIHDIDIYEKSVKFGEEKQSDLGFVYYKRENGRLVPYKKRINMTYNNRSVPRQAIPESEKDLDWCKDNLRAITKTLGKGGKYNGSRNKDIANYNLYNGFVNGKDYEYITEQYGVPYPAQMNNFPLTQTKIDLLVNEDTERPLDKKVSSINKDAALRKEKFKVSLIANKLLEDVNKQFKEQFNVDAPSENEGFPIPEDIDTFMRYEYKELIEEVCQDGLDYLVNKYRLKDIFRDGFRDFLVTGKEFYKVYIKNGDPYVRRVDPRSCIWDMSIQNDYLEDAQWVGEERWMTVNEILDEYREELKKEDVHELEEMSKLNDMEGVASYNDELEWLQYDKNKGIKIRVISCEWKSVKQIKYKISENKHNPSEPFKKVVGEDYKSRKKEKLENVYIDDIWEATEIGGKIYVQCRRRPNQVRSVDDVGTTPLSYVGCVHNYSTGNSKSLVDLLRHVQMMYNIVHYHIELTLARSGGKAVVYDVSQMPTDMGMDMQSVMYHLKTDGIIPINSMQEGQEVSKFNQFQQVDFTLSNSVQQLINLKLMLEQTAGYISGVSPQREGAVGQYEYVGNVQRSVVQSSLSTKGWFFQHGEVKKMIFGRLCNLMKVCWSQGKKAGYVLGDGGYKFLNVLPDIALNDYGVFLGDSGKDDSMRQVVQQMSQAALQQGSLTMLDAIKVLKSESLAEAETVLEKGLDTMKKMAQQQNEQAMAQQQAAAEQEQAAAQAEAEMKQAELQTKIKVAEIDAKSRIDVAEINSDTRLQAEDTKEKNKLVLEGIKADLQDQASENESRRVAASEKNKQ